MTYIGWAALYEGSTDRQYFDVLLPRIMDALVLSKGTRSVTISPTPIITFQRGSSDSVAKQICQDADAYHLVFIHADTGGRALEARLAERACNICDEAEGLCGWKLERCIVVAPRHELEAWTVADGSAVCDALGYRGSAKSIGLPSTPIEAERLVDPKATLGAALKSVSGRRRTSNPIYLFPTIAQRQDLTILRQLPSFRTFESSLAEGLKSLGCIT